MAIARVTEIITASPVSIEDAVQRGVAKVAETIHNIQSVWVKETLAEVKDGKIAEWRVGLKVTFIVD